MISYLTGLIGNEPAACAALVAAVIILIMVLVRIVQRLFARRIRVNEARYRTRKLVSFLGYVASLAGFFAITFGGYFKPGDRVQFGGVRGDVIDIGLVRTTLMELGEWVDGDLFTGRVVRVSNGAVFREPVFNYSGEFTRASSEAWRSLVTRYLVEKARVEPLVTMVADESWVTFTIRYIVDYRLRRSTSDRFFERILAGFIAGEGSVEIAAASSEVALSTENTLEMRLDQDRKQGE